jgi:hypothetical protein
VNYAEFLDRKLHAGRRAIGIELKPSYFCQAVRNLTAEIKGELDQLTLMEV